MTLKQTLTVTVPVLAALLGAPHTGLAQDAPAAPAAEAPATPMRQGDAATVVATVNGKDITLGNMIVLRGNLPAQYQSLPDATLFKGMLDQLIQQEALADTVTPGAKDRLAMQNDARGYLSGVALAKIVDGVVTDDALKAAYDAKYGAVDAGTEYHAAHILVPTEEKARELKDEIAKGADFAEVAKANSSDGSAANGGDLGWFGPGMMVKPFEDAVVGLKAGEISDPIQTQFGWHIIKLLETRKAEPPKLDDVRDTLAQEIQQEAVAKKVDELTKAATITRPGADLDPALLRDQSLVDGK